MWMICFENKVLILKLRKKVERCLQISETVMYFFLVLWRVADKLIKQMQRIHIK